MYRVKTAVGEKVLEETVKKIYPQYMVRFPIVGIIGVILISTMWYVIVRGQDSVIFWLCTLICLVGAIACLIIALVRIPLAYRKIVNKLSDQIFTIYHENYIENETTVDEGIMKLKINGNESDVLLGDLMAVKETNNYVILIFKGNVVSNVIKSSIEGGTPKEFMDYCKGYMNK